MTNLKELNKQLKSLREDIPYEDLSVEDVAKIISDITLDDIELFDDDKVRKLALETRYEKYPMYSLDSQTVYVIKSEDFVDFVKDLADHMAACLPDGFDRFFNAKELADTILDDFSYSHQANEFLNKFDGDYDDYDYINEVNGWVGLKHPDRDYD